VLVEATAYVQAEQLTAATVSRPARRPYLHDSPARRPSIKTGRRCARKYGRAWLCEISDPSSGIERELRRSVRHGYSSLARTVSELPLI